MDSERRAAPRHTFIAHAELCDEGRSTRLKTRVSDLSLTGCYLDMLHPLPVGTNIALTILDAAGSFDIKGKIVYAVPTLGVGVSFVDVTPELSARIERSLNHPD
jgi:PilZ domain